MKKNNWIKVLIIWALYVGLHFTHKYIPCGLTQLFGCPEETIFHHMKMAYLAYSLVSIIEFFILKPHYRESFISSRILSVILISYFSFMLWFFVPVVIGPIHTEWFEIVYSNLILAFSLSAVVYIETFTEKISFNKTIMRVLTLLYLIILTVFVVSTFSPPEMDVFSPLEHAQ